jgi:adenosylhomocysteine nucleosidase
VDVPVEAPDSVDARFEPGPSLMLACALAVEEKAARAGGARVARIGLGAGLPLPEGRLVAFGLTGALVDGLAPGTLVTARRVVDEEGTVLWEDEPLRVPGAVSGVVCDAEAIVDDAAARLELARRTGAVAVDMESATLAATGRLAGVIRAVSDTPENPIGRLGQAALPDGRTNWRMVLRALFSEPRATVRTALGTKQALSSLRSAATALAPRATP